MTASNPLTEFSAELWDQTSIHKIIQRAMSRPDAQTFKFDGDMILASKPLWDWAEYVVDHYEGEWDLMVKFRTLQRTGTQLSKAQLAVALNSLLKCWKRSLEFTAKQVAEAQREYPSTEELGVFDQPQDLASIPAVQVSEMVQTDKGWTVKNAPEGMKVKVKIPHPGTYTFVDANGEYRVVKFSVPDPKRDFGAMYVSYQYGSDNVRDFAKCGKIKKDGMLTVWGSAFHRGEVVQKHTPAQRADLFGAIVFICSFDKESQLAAGEAYALKSGVCFICGRNLTVPSSISQGMGPICAERWIG